MFKMWNIKFIENILRIHFVGQHCKLNNFTTSNPYVLYVEIFSVKTKFSNFHSAIANKNC